MSLLQFASPTAEHLCKSWGGPLGPRPTPSSAFSRCEVRFTGKERVQGDPRGPGGPPHSLGGIYRLGGIYGL
jgi:hypothetical protein